MESITFVFAEPGDESEVIRLLSACQLPIEGITPHLHHFILARSQSTIIGVIGLELYERVALLRSMAVASDFRRTGIGTALYERMLAHAHTLNIRALYLLTTTAGDFFTRRGFVVMERNLAPDALRSSVEFRKLCPDSAICMLKQTGGEAICFPHDMLALKPDVPGSKMWGVALEKTLLTCFELEPHCRFDEHSHESEQITMVLEGELYFEFEHNTCCIKKGDVIAIPSNVSHAVYTHELSAKAIDAWSPVMPQYIRPD